MLTPTRTGDPAGAPGSAEQASQQSLLLDAEALQSSLDSRYGGLRLGPGDLIRMTMHGFPEMEMTAHVSDQGRVNLPLIGNVDVGGLTPTDAEARVADAYREARYFRHPQPNITVQEFRSGQISVLGHVGSPGRFPLDTTLTVLDAIALAQGVRETGGWVATLIRPQRDGVLRSEIRLPPEDGPGPSQATLTLQPGDIIHVPEARHFYIDGEVNRPDRYVLRPGLTVQQAISQGGGITPRGSYSRVLIKRKNDRGELQSIRARASDQVSPGDVVVVRGAFF